MNSTFLVSVLAVTVFLSSCNQSDSRPRIKTEYHIVKSTYSGQEHIVQETRDTFYYTADGKPDLTRNGLTFKEERKGDIVESTTSDRSGKVISSSMFFFNKAGMMDSFIYKNATWGDNIHKYIYDEKGYLVEDRLYSKQPPSVILTHKVMDGNRVETRMTNIPATDTSFAPNPVTGKMDTIVMVCYDELIRTEYFSDKLNLFRSEHGAGKEQDQRSKNLEKLSVQLSPKGDTTDITFYRYTFDDEGRVMTVVQAARSGEGYDSTAYSYY